MDGTVWRFKTEPVDPNDPFRGKYITLAYSDRTWKTDSTDHFLRKGPIYVTFENDEEGFAKISGVYLEEPVDEVTYLKTIVQYVNAGNYIEVKYPFDRYYMEESKATEAETIQRHAENDEESETYALVRILEGDAVLEDVLIDGVPIKEAVENARTHAQ